MESVINDYIKNNNLVQCVSMLREKTRCYELMELICQKIEYDDSIDKPTSFWDDYAIILFYLGKKGKSYDCYRNIFSYPQTILNEGNTNHYLNNFKHSIIDNMKVECDQTRTLGSYIGEENIAITKFDLKNEESQYNLFNPSIVSSKNGYIMNLRAANYKLDDNFRYSGSGYYNTINYLVNLDENLNVKDTKEVSNTIMQHRGNFNGWEDMRLFYYKDKLHGSFTTLGATPNRLQHICLSNLEEDCPKYELLDGYGKGQVQKNWVATIVDEKLYFIYSFYPLTVLKYNEVNRNVDLHQVSLPNTYNRWRGGSTAISLKNLSLPDYYLCIIHESNFPVYKQRFVLLKLNYGDVFEVYNYSPTFSFIDTTIEFCAGISISHDKKDFILSFGKMDREVYVAKVNANCILKNLLSPKLKIIENPHVIVPSNKLDSPYTFVTCFFNLEKLEGKERLHPVNMYIEKSKFLLNQNINLVVYCDDDDMIELITKIRQNFKHRTKIIKKNMTELPYYKHHDFVKNEREKNNYNGFTKTKDTPLFTVLTWSKFTFLQEAIKENYFEDNYFNWIDFGITYVASTNNYINSFNKKSEKVAIQCINVPDHNITNIGSLGKWMCFMSGGFFGGHKNNMIKFIEKFDESLNIMIQNNVAPLEEIIMAHVTYRHSQLFEFYYADYYEIISNRAYLYSTSNFHLIMRNIEKCMSNNMKDKACHIIKYILSAFNNGYIQLDNAMYQKIMIYYNSLFFEYSHLQ
jgi:hypothetical protein